MAIRQLSVERIRSFYRNTYLTPKTLHPLWAMLYAHWVPNRSRPLSIDSFEQAYLIGVLDGFEQLTFADATEIYAVGFTDGVRLRYAMANFVSLPDTAKRPTKIHSDKAMRILLGIETDTEKKQKKTDDTRKKML